MTISVRTKEKCVVRGCKRPVRVKRHQLCQPHYKRFQRTGDPGPAKIKNMRRLPTYTPAA